LARCQKYLIAKDSFTEIVLLTVIAYFCVSTEHRFINMCQEREEAKREKQQKSMQEEVKPQASVSSQLSGPQTQSIRSHGQAKELAVSLQRSSKGDHTTHSSSQQPKPQDGETGMK
jgi:Na+-translocating ferredoxin:NAD+ oxidoreductase RnfG subunit